MTFDEFKKLAESHGYKVSEGTDGYFYAAKDNWSITYHSIRLTIQFDLECGWAAETPHEANLIIRDTFAKAARIEGFDE